MTDGFTKKVNGKNKFIPTDNNSNKISKGSVEKDQIMESIHNNNKKQLIIHEKLTKDEWEEILKDDPLIVDEQRKYLKYFNKINKPYGFAFSDMDHFKRAEEKLDSRLEKLAKQHNYIPDGYTAYQPWHDHPHK